MKKNWLNRIKKVITIGLVAAMTMASTMIPVLADELQQPGEPPRSQWALETLNEGEKYGIYPMSWYTDGIQEDITGDQVSVLLENVETKLSTLGLEKDEAFVPAEYEKDGTRGSVLTGLYNSVAVYKLPEELEKDKNNAIEYMQKRGVVNGTSKGLELETECTVEQAVVFATNLIEDTYDAVDAGSKGFMWKVEEGDNTVYLLGSIHKGNTDLYPINKKVKDAFERSDVLLVEADTLDPQAAQVVMEMAMYTDGTTLKDHLSEEVYTKYAELFEQAGLPTDVFDGFRPRFVQSQLEAMAADSPQEILDAGRLGIDMYFLSTGALTGKPVVELEGVEFQINLFNSMSAEQQEADFSKVLDAIMDPESTLFLDQAEITNTWLELWSEGDIDGFLDSYAAELEEAQDEFQEKMLGERDRNMADKIADLLEEDGEATYFVVVGAAHLTIEGTVVDELESKGYTVERFWE